MKLIIAIVLLVGLCTAQMPGRGLNSQDIDPSTENTISTADANFCHSQVEKSCNNQLREMLSGDGVCNACYGGIKRIQPEVQAYINTQLAKSYEYLLLATHFNSYMKNRPGFRKLYQGLSDRSFDDAIDLIKQITRRGGEVNFNAKHEHPAMINTPTKQLDVHELYSLAIALDNEKQLSKGAIHVHNRAIHAAENDRDPEMAHYFEEKFLGKQAETVRKLSGYTNDLAKLIKHDEPTLSVYLFDEYLQKQ